MTQRVVRLNDQAAPRPTTNPLSETSTPPEADHVGEEVDLVIVGAGLSGLATAYYYQHRFGPTARILLLDTAEHVGGMTRRIELEVDGHRLVTYGGAAALNGTRSWASHVSRRFFADLGIDLSSARPDDQDQASPFALRSSIFFDRETYGESRLVVGDWPAGNVGPSDRDQILRWVGQFPYAPEQKAAIADLWLSDRVTLGHLNPDTRRNYLERTSYRSFLRNDWGLDAGAVDLFTRRTIGIFGSPAACVPALECMRVGLPGFNAVGVDGLDRYRWLDEPEIRFPDGLATVARLALERIEPATTGGRLDAETLDSPRNKVRVRLASTVVRIQNVDDGVEVDYLRDGEVYRVRSEHCVYAGAARTLPDILPEVGDEQRHSLSRVVKPPMCYVKVALRNWRAFAELGIRDASSPGAFFYKLELDQTIVGGGQRSDPDEPAVVLLCHRPVVDPNEQDYRREAAAAQEAMFATSAEDYRDAVEDQLGRILGSTGFDPEETIAAVSVNRWPHTYSPTVNTLTDEPAAYAREMLVSRRPVGRMTIAGVDSHRFGWAQAAVDAAERAVNELPSGGPELLFDAIMSAR
ncbi:NAD(P)-binding protein [Nonomuraea sp. NPDC026600]|uniref:NAD(P)-binding protein n=1 Tax=Nonomuraea sp. NPDC026600 TaxID=3155363 RepID=UPI0033E40D98